MTAYIDSSAILAIEFREDGYQGVLDRIGEHEDIVASNLVEAEIRAATAREQRTFNQPLHSNITWIYTNRPLTNEFDRVLRVGYLRGADLWHVAVALYASPDPSQISFITLDTRQRNVARELGFQT
ncbi:MAG: type II toxin-antitoxin system VapC family toxin [Chloroflexi bacterium]|nr:type II toxin-antitoxin system VapC family toxin [Chloroflexota bacterium]MYF79421.1 type II toxin-antitoxin system VapC family toxin [Chloroflexota bacterium]